MHTKVVIIICWFGDFPWYFPYFLHSCGYNPTIDFQIVTNNLTDGHLLPQNVKVIRRELKQIIQSGF